MTARKSPSPCADVEIGGRTYRIRGENPAELHALARDVDRALEDVAGPGKKTDDFKVAVLAALNLAADGEDLRKGWMRRARQIGVRAREISDRLETLERQIDGTAPTPG